MEKINTSDFLIAAFGVDGEIEGISRKAFNGLSDKWLKICEEYLAFNGASFDMPWSGALAHLQTRFTGELGFALATFRVRGRIAASIALASGLSPLAESSVLKMFVESLRAVDIVSLATRSDTPFGELFHITQRPLMVVVPFADSEISDQDQALVRELSLHIAGAFFIRSFDLAPVSRTPG